MTTKDIDLAEYVQSKRMALVETLMPNDQVPAHDNDQMRILLTALTDIDRTNIGHKRLSLDAKIVSDREQVLGTLRAIEATVTGNPYRREGLVTVEGPAMTQPVYVEDAVFSEGEVMMGEDGQNFEEFMHRTSN